MKKEPKFTIVLIEINGDKHRMSSCPSKVKNFGNLSLVKKGKLGNFKSLNIKFFYGRDKDGIIANEMVCKTYEDLIWAYKAFSDDLLWL